ncbi:hypothetical protein P8452_56814 [Trifolium repens]|nr:hypothetical protein P8452_56814 [Trifolium repens]
MDDKFLFQKITPTKMKVAVAYLTRTVVYIMDKSGNKWTCEFVLNHLSELQKLRSDVYNAHEKLRAKKK